jgi:hypothetical protein
MSYAFGSVSRVSSIASFSVEGAISFLPVEEEQPYPTKKFTVSSIQHLVEDAPKPWEQRPRYREKYWNVYPYCGSKHSARELEPIATVKTWEYT